MNSRIILVSHALTQWNVDGRIQGHTDTPLNPLGHKMAKFLAARLANEKIEAIFASDLQRAFQTAEPVAILKRLTIQTDIRLREGRSVYQEQNSEYPILSFHKDVENEKDVRERMAAVLTEIAENNPCKTVLVVSHKGAIELFITNVLSRKGHVSMAYLGKRTALNRLDYKNGCWTCLSLDDDLHLGGIKETFIHMNKG
jgi:broad specificity phosphatase PhoE